MLITGKNSFIYQSHPLISHLLRRATVLSSLNLSSKTKKTQHQKRRGAQNSPMTV